MGEKAIMQKTNEQIKKRLLNLPLWTEAGKENCFQSGGT